jgi:hypothetical protein
MEAKNKMDKVEAMMAKMKSTLVKVGLGWLRWRRVGQGGGWLAKVEAVIARMEAVVAKVEAMVTKAEAMMAMVEA